MIIKIMCRLLLTACLMFSAVVAAESESIGQTLQINTHFTSIRGGKPTWLLVLRDMETGQISPYIFDIRNRDNFWIAFSNTHTYRVTISNLKFGPYAVINNFCHLEDGVLMGKSMFITLTGRLSPNPNSSVCHVLKYNDASFTIVKKSAKEESQ